MTLQNIKGIPQAALRGKSVLVRIDVDSQHLAKPAFGDEEKLRRALPTLQYLESVGAPRILASETISDCFIADRQRREIVVVP